MKGYLLAVALLAGCSAIAPAHNVQTYRASGQVDAWHISGRIDAMSQVLTVTINGQDAVTGNLSMWDGLGTISGMYQGKPISATCEAVNRRRQCQVIVGSESAATLLF